MAKYYKAVQIIWANLDTIVKPNSFNKWLEPNPHFNRTPRHLLLKAVSYPNGDKFLQELCTPFGEVKFLSRGTLTNQYEYSKKFFELMSDQWIITDVTNPIEIYRYAMEDSNNKEILYKQFIGTQPPFAGLEEKNRLYTIKSVGDTILLNDSEMSSYKAIIYCGCMSSHQQHQADKALFTKLSNGKNHC